MPRVFISLGSNIGDRSKFLSLALTSLAPDFRIISKSSVYETDPWGYEDQEKFLNQVAELETAIQPAEVLEKLKSIESNLGRKTGFRYGPREIDLDLLFYDDLILDTEQLQIPHPRIPERAFVLIPLQEIAPDFVHPVLGKTIMELSNEISGNGVIKFTPMDTNLPELVWGQKTYVMGIMNITPDSFSGDGILNKKNTLKLAHQQAAAFIQEGAHILDFGAESSRPGSARISAEEELKRVLPIIKQLVSNHKEIYISIDTYKSKTARACLEAGAHWINDIWGLQADPDLAPLIADYDASVILMHNRSRQGAVLDLGDLGNSYDGTKYQDLILDIKEDLSHSIDIALAAGIRKERIIIDPGIGFGKTVQQNLALINRLVEFKSMGFPVLIGPSRKSFIGKTLDLPVGEREEGTAAAIAVGITRGADIVRVHNVKMMARVAKMTDAIIRA